MRREHYVSRRIFLYQVVVCRTAVSSNVDLDRRYMGIENLKTLYLLCKERLGGDLDNDFAIG